MRIPGLALRHRITITPAAGFTGEATTYGTPVANIPADVDERVSVHTDSTGQSISTWERIRIRPTVRVAGRAPAAGDLAEVDGVTRPIASARATPGPGRSIAYVTLIAGDTTNDGGEADGGDSWT